MSDAIIEAAARVIYNNGLDDGEEYSERHYATARAVVREVTPLIEEAALKRWHHDLAYVKAAALEEAAQRIEADQVYYLVRDDIAAAIRALKEQP